MCARLTNVFVHEMLLTSRHYVHSQSLSFNPSSKAGTDAWMTLMTYFCICAERRASWERRGTESRERGQGLRSAPTP